MKRFFVFLCVFGHLSLAHAQSWDGLSESGKIRAIKSASQKHFGKKKLKSNTRIFRQDCSGYIQTVFTDLGMDLDAFYGAYRIRTNGVNLIRHFVQRVGTYQEQGTISIGDLLFFSNTYDRNKNAKQDDDFTHIAIVESIDRDGTIAFLHYLNGRVRRDWINFKHPHAHIRNKQIINSYLRRHTSYGKSALSSQLFTGLGRLDP